MSENESGSGTTVTEAFAEMARLINHYFPTPPEQPYLGNRCGWYPEKPKRRRKAQR